MLSFTFSVFLLSSSFIFCHCLCYQEVSAFLTDRTFWNRFQNFFSADLKSEVASGGLFTGHADFFKETDAFFPSSWGRHLKVYLCWNTGGLCWNTSSSIIDPHLMCYWRTQNTSLWWEWGSTYVYNKVTWAIFGLYWNLGWKRKWRQT